MSEQVESRIERIPVLRNLMHVLQRIKLPWLNGFTLYDLLELYFTGIGEGALPYRAGAIAFSFFMALFPFLLFILNLIPYIPISGFQQDFLKFVEEGVPPNTYDAIAAIINDIMNNSYQGLLSSGFLLSIFLQANGLNAVLVGFQKSQHVEARRGFFRQYLVALAMSLLLTFILILTVAIIVIFEVFIRSTDIPGIISDNIPLIVLGRYIFVILMILIGISILFKFGTKRTAKRAFISVGSVVTTILVILSSYFFGIWVVKFSKYNELYGSIGTLLIVMFYIWINCMVLLLGFELNVTINRLKKKKLN
ncbi:MAG: ribonuclease BN [Flavobacterium sp. BFFFF1]|uniref:YihY/virulence factor BrkB family protein n=1 Tax=Flavobacterium sp. BFFFF1 TaxID=2015557 RepID=UPI000BC79E21|nr:YihY/virulence factor BrkB family protein [Flavobacterium sp. BFFFF1]OYU81850.1 MAG: ribonuclease BN [Flavobacterium sp. BFFFF1]